jgi:hypothetical protein
MNICINLTDGKGIVHEQLLYDVGDPELGGQLAVSPSGFVERCNDIKQCNPELEN